MTDCVVVRVWLADRPGSLGEVATRIGDLGGDLVGVDILERDGSRAVDELTIELTDGSSPAHLAEALSHLSGVEVEDLRHLVPRVPNTGRDPLAAAVLLAESDCQSELLNALSQGVCAAFACDWSTVLDTGGPGVTALAEAGHPPRPAWLGAFVAGAKAGRSLSAANGAGLAGPRDVAWAPLGSSDVAVVAGRDGPPFRSRERRQLEQLCRIADARWNDVARAGARGAHPSGTRQSGRNQLAVS